MTIKSALLALVIIFTVLTAWAQQPLTNLQLPPSQGESEASKKLRQRLVTHPVEQDNRHFDLFNRGLMTVHQMLADRSYFALCAAEYSGSALDMQTTSSTIQWYHFSDPPTKLYAPFFDADPLARPFVNLPKPAYYATGWTFATGLNLLGWKLKHSSRLRKIWWIPQVVGSGVSFYSGVENNRTLDSQINAWKHYQSHRASSRP